MKGGESQSLLFLREVLTYYNSRWDNATYSAAQKDRQDMQDQFRSDFPQKPSKERVPIAEQAQALLEGKQKWAPTTTEWVDDGDPVEVEADVKLPRREKSGPTMPVL